MTGQVIKETKSGMTMSTSEVELVKCECCALTEECTAAYILKIRERHGGRWICGLCAEAVKEEIIRAEERIGKEEAMVRHINFCEKFRMCTPPQNASATENLISAVRQLFRRRLDSPTIVRSNPNSPMSKDGSGLGLTRPTFILSESCFSSLHD